MLIFLGLAILGLFFLIFGRILVRVKKERRTGAEVPSPETELPPGCARSAELFLGIALMVVGLIGMFGALLSD